MEGLWIYRAVSINSSTFEWPDLSRRLWAKGHLAEKLTYVGVSRVKSMKGLVLEESFNLSRFRGKEGITERMRLADAERRRPQHLGLSLFEWDVFHRKCLSA
jgi:hypothetical protein